MQSNELRDTYIPDVLLLFVSHIIGGRARLIEQTACSGSAFDAVRVVRVAAFQTTLPCDGAF